MAFYFNYSSWTSWIFKQQYLKACVHSQEIMWPFFTLQWPTTEKIQRINFLPKGCCSPVLGLRLPVCELVQYFPDCLFNKQSLLTLPNLLPYLCLVCSLATPLDKPTQSKVFPLLWTVSLHPLQFYFYLFIVWLFHGTPQKDGVGLMIDFLLTLEGRFMPVPTETYSVVTPS